MKTLYNNQRYRRPGIAFHFLLFKFSVVKLTEDSILPRNTELLSAATRYIFCQKWSKINDQNINLIHQNFKL